MKTTTLIGLVSGITAFGFDVYNSNASETGRKKLHDKAVEHRSDDNKKLASEFLSLKAETDSILGKEKEIVEDRLEEFSKNYKTANSVTDIPETVSESIRNTIKADVVSQRSDETQELFKKYDKVTSKMNKLNKEELDKISYNDGFIWWCINKKISPKKAAALRAVPGALVFVGASAIAYGSAKEGIKVYKALTSVANGE